MMNGNFVYIMQHSGMSKMKRRPYADDLKALQIYVVCTLHTLSYAIKNCQTSAQPSVWNAPLPRLHPVSSKQIFMLFRKVHICTQQWNIHGFSFQERHMSCYNMIRIIKNCSTLIFVFIIIKSIIILLMTQFKGRNEKWCYSTMPTFARIIYRPW